MSMTNEITFSTTAYYKPSAGTSAPVDIQVKVSVLNNQIFYQVVKFNDYNIATGILIIKNGGGYSERYSYRFRYEKRHYFLNIDD